MTLEIGVKRNDYIDVISDKVCSQIVTEVSNNQPSKSEAAEAANHPSHYKGQYEAIDILEDACPS